MSEEVKIQELPQPNPDVSSYSRSEMVGVLKILLQKNLSLDQAIALAIVQQYAPNFERDLLRHLERTLHPQFKEIVQVVQGSTTSTRRFSLFGRKKNPEAEQS